MDKQNKEEKPKSEGTEIFMMIKEINVKTLVSGDKAGRIILETLYPIDVEKLTKFASDIEVKVIIIS